MSPRDDLFGGHGSFSRLLGLHARRGGARIVDELLAVRTRFREDVLTLDLDVIQLGFDLRSIGEPARDLLATGLEHLEDGLVRERVQHRADDPEADHLGAQMHPIHAEGPGDLSHG
jgi:hypothetical protein